MPKLRINDLYASAIRQHRGSAALNGAGAGLNSRLQEARWFIKNIQQRFDTILRVSQAIVERQKSFFTHGEIAMKPLVLREIADELGLHESTISRVTTAKYMATPFGTFELKYFFGSSLGTEAGGNASSTAVRALIKQFVAAEDPAKPLSDSQISRDARGAGHPRAPAAPSPSTARRCRSRRRNCARRCSRRDAAILTTAPLFLPCAAGVEALLADEVRAPAAAAGVDVRRARRRRAARRAARGDACSTCDSRLAQRVLVEVAHAPYRDEDDLYALAQRRRLGDWFTPRADASRSTPRRSAAR